MTPASVVSSGYEVVNDAERLRHDPAIGWIVGYPFTQFAIHPGFTR
jgi:hypothetical protein